MRRAVRNASTAAGVAPTPLSATPVEVIWRDAAFEMDAETPASVHVLSTLGWLMRDDADCIVVAGEADAKRAYFRSYTCIPRECVVAIHALRRYGGAKAPRP